MSIKNITHHTPAQIQHLATQRPGLPDQEVMQPKMKAKISKSNYFASLPFLGGPSKDQTTKFNGNKKKMEAKWREFDLPNQKLAAQSELHLHGMLARAEHRNSSSIPEGVGEVLEESAERIERMKGTEATFLNALALLEGDDPEGAGEALQKQLDLLAGRLAGQAELQKSAQKKLEGDSTAPERAAAEAALAAVANPGVRDADRAHYTNARNKLIEASTEKFFDAYCALREHEGDQARAKGMKTVLPAMARHFELPTKYLDGLEALPIAEQILDNVAMAPADKEAARAQMKRQLVGKVVLDLTAGRTEELPGTPPKREEADVWKKEADRLKALAKDFGTVEQVLGETMPELKKRADAAQGQMIEDLVNHFPMSPMSAEQRAETGAALRGLAASLAAAGALQKDVPLAPMQLMHIVSMVEGVTGNDAARSLAVYQSLANDHAHGLIGTVNTHLQSGEAMPAAVQDLMKVFEMSAHVVPEAVSSLLACNPRHLAPTPDTKEKIDWRDVQTFFRCSQEHARLAASPEPDQAHMDRMKGAMASMRDELLSDVQPEIGSPARRDWAMVKGAIWKQENAAHVTDTLDNFQTTLSLPGTLVSQMQGQFVKKNRGDAHAEARDAFKDTLKDIQSFAADAVASARTPKEKEDAKLLQATAEYIGQHRGTEKAFTRLSRVITQKDATFNSGKEAWTNPLKAKEKQAIFDAAGISRPSNAASMLSHPGLVQAKAGHSALDLLREAVTAVGAEGGAALLEKLSKVQDKITLTDGGALDGPEAIRRVLHDAIDRTELGDRSDTINGQQFKLAIPFGGPVATGVALYGNVGHTHTEGMIVNVQANNDCVQLTMGRTTETAVSAGLNLSITPDAISEAVEDRLPKKLKVALPGVGVKEEAKLRVDPAVVFKISIDPKDGLRDLGEAKQALKSAVDMLADFRPGESLDSQGVPYKSAYEMVCDKLDSPFTIDDEVRETTSRTHELTANLGRVAGILDDKGDDDHARAGFSASAKLVKTSDVMESRNQQGAREMYDTRKNIIKLEGLLGVNTPHSAIKSEETAPAGSGSKTEDKTLFNFPVSTGIGGGVDINVGGSEYKLKLPVGTDKLVAYKKEYGDYSRDMQQALNVLLEALPSVVNRVQEVVDKGFRARMELELAAKAEIRPPKGDPSPQQLALKEELGGLSEEIAGLRGEIARRGTDMEERRANLQPGTSFDSYVQAEMGEPVAELQHQLDGKLARLAEGQHQLKELDVKQSHKELVDKELSKMEGEVVMDFARALMLDKTDRFSVKAESKQQWAHRGIDSAIEIAEKNGDEGMAQVMRHVAAQVFANDKDQAVKYLIAAGDLSSKQSQWDIKSPLYFKRREVKGMSEDPVPDTRTATLNPTAQRLMGARHATMAMGDVASVIAKASLAQVRADKDA